MKNKRLFNYLVNTYGLSKDKVLSQMELRFKDLELKVNKEVDRKIKEYFESFSGKKFIQDRIVYYLQNNLQRSGNSFKLKNFNEYIKERINHTIEKEIKKQLQENYKAEIVIKRNNNEN